MRAYLLTHMARSRTLQRPWAALALAEMERRERRAHRPPSVDVQLADDPDWQQFYTFLAESDDDITIMEAPSISTSPTSLHLFASYQVGHRQRVVLLNRRAAYKGKSEGVELNSIRPLKQSIGLGLEGIDYIIVHRDFIDERRRLMESSGVELRNPVLGTQTERELKDKAARLVEEFDNDDTYLPVLRTQLVAIFAVTPDAVEAYRSWNAERD